MLDWMYSDVSLAEQFEKGHQFYIAGIHKGDGPVDEVGFCSVSKEGIEKSEAVLVDEPKNLKATAHKLNKLYVLPSAHGNGSGKALLNKAIEVSKAEGSSSLFLQVNRHNNAYTFYVKNGFIKEQEFKLDIGNGFYMDDYIMRLTF